MFPEKLQPFLRGKWPSAFNSLTGRIIVATALWALIVLPIAGWTLNSIYRDKVEQEFDRRLDQLMTLLLASTGLDEGVRPTPPADLGDALFNLPIKNGWYWQIEPIGNRETWSVLSESLTGQPLNLAGAVSNDIDTNPTRGPSIKMFDADLEDGQRLRVIRRRVRTERDGVARQYVYTITGNRNEVDRDVANFAGKIALSLSVLGLGLLGLVFLLVKFGLKPLRQIEAGLGRIRSGEAERLEGDFPTEVQPLQTELNALIQSNLEVVERARTHVGNLAHALKTPLSVISNEADRAKTPLAAKVTEQTRIMRDQVNHYLDRARMAARVAVISSVTPVGEPLSALARTLERINQDRGIRVRVSLEGEPFFQGEKQDLEEMLGNLMDNACKWATSSVNVAVASSTDSSGFPRHPHRLQITVEDDGPGLTPQQRTDAVKRGRRLDESRPGSGLGLSIVQDLVELYGGTFDLSEAELGGLRASLDLPAVGR